MDRDEGIRLLSSGPKGVDRWNRWRRRKSPNSIPGLQFADFRCANLRGANLAHCDLSEADLIDTDFTGADLRDAVFHEVDITGANFSYAKLRGADFSGALAGSTIWAHVDLSDVIGLDSLVHAASSAIGIETLLMSASLADEFLVGCGVPETLVEYVKSFSRSLQPIQFYSCFVSYSHKDETFAKRLHGQLRQEGLRVWFAPEDMQGGKKLHHQIDEAIRLHDKLLLILSDVSMNSEWVATEIYNARQRELREGRQVLFPIRLIDFERIRDWECFDADTGKDMAREIREYFIPDFSEWKDHDKFEAAFARLLADLKTSA